LKPVDYVLLDKNVKWSATSHFDTMEPVFTLLKPDVFLVNDDAVGIEERRRICKLYNVKFIILKRTCPPEFENISTSNIIKKIQSF